MEKSNKSLIIKEEVGEDCRTTSSVKLTSLEEEYVKSLSEVEKATMKIAEDHLKTSFCMKKSIGYLKWLSQNSK